VDSVLDLIASPAATPAVLGAAQKHADRLEAFLLEADGGIGGGSGGADSNAAALKDQLARLRSGLSLRLLSSPEVMRRQRVRSI